MFADLVGWYTGRDQNRRRYPRVKREFSIEYTLDNKHWLAALGMDLSGGGLCMASAHKIPHITFQARIDLNGHLMVLRVQAIWNATTPYMGRETPYYGLQFVSVKPADWETIMKFITGHHPTKREMFEPIAMDENAVNSLLPREFRDEVVRALAKRSRIDAQRPSAIQFEYGGVMRENDRRVHRFTVRSSIKTDAGEKRFSTQLLVQDEDNEITIVS